MKKSLFLLILSSIILSGCSTSRERQATEKYIKANSVVLEAVAFAANAIDKKINANIEISSWNSTPIDTITAKAFYLDALRKSIEDANTYKKYTLYEDSIKVSHNHDRYLHSFSEYMKNYFYHEYQESLDKWEADKAEYAKLVSLIGDLRKSMEETGEEHLYYVYQFSERINFKNPLTNEKVEEELLCFSYVSLRTNSVVKVDENCNSYIRSLNRLPSPITMKVANEDDLPVLL